MCTEQPSQFPSPENRIRIESSEGDKEYDIFHFPDTNGNYVVFAFPALNTIPIDKDNKINHNKLLELYRAEYANELQNYILATIELDQNNRPADAYALDRYHIKFNNLLNDPQNPHKNIIEAMANNEELSKILTGTIRESINAIRNEKGESPKPYDVYYLKFPKLDENIDDESLNSQLKYRLIRFLTKKIFPEDTQAEGVKIHNLEVIYPGSRIRNYNQPGAQSIILDRVTSLHTTGIIFKRQISETKEITFEDFYSWYEATILPNVNIRLNKDQRAENDLWKKRVEAWIERTKNNASIVSGEKLLNALDVDN